MKIGTPFRKNATRLLLLGSGELGREVAIEAIRYGLHVIACDRYDHAPAMQVAQEKRVFSMTDRDALERTVKEAQPDFIVPEIEAIATELLIELEKQGYRVIPTARATRITMDREGIRRLASEQLGLPVTKYEFASNKEEYLKAVEKIGIPLVVKPVMSSSGKGQSIVRNEDQIEIAFATAIQGARGSVSERVIVEKFLPFDYEITLLTVKQENSTQFCEPIGHLQIDGDYRESWQPQPMNPDVLQKARDIARKVTDSLGGTGIFGVELFVKNNDVYFSEVSPRPHDTGMVTMISQNLSEFALHVRAILGLPIDEIRQYGPAASAVILSEANGTEIEYDGLDKAIGSDAADEIRIFGKPEIRTKRRLGVSLAMGSSIETARMRAVEGASRIQVTARD